MTSIDPSKYVTQFNESVKTFHGGKTYRNLGQVVKVIGAVGLLISGSIAAAPYISFTAAYLTYSMAMSAASVALASSIGLMIIGVIFDKVGTQGLTQSKRAEISANYLLAKMTEGEAFELNAEDIKKFNSFYPLIVGQGHHLNSIKSIQLTINDKGVSREQILDLLKTAIENDIVLHLSSLEEKGVNLDQVETIWKKAGNHQSKIDSVRRSALLSAGFLKRALENDTLKTSSIQNQLNALAVKYISADEVRAVNPAVFFDMGGIHLSSKYGEVGRMEEILEALGAKDDLEQAILIDSGGFKKTHCGSDARHWNMIFSKIIKRFNAEIIDQARRSFCSKKALVEMAIWQDELPPIAE